MTCTIIAYNLIIIISFIIYKSNMRAKDPVRDCLRIIKNFSALKLNSNLSFNTLPSSNHHYHHHLIPSFSFTTSIFDSISISRFSRTERYVTISRTERSLSFIARKYEVGDVEFNSIKVQEEG